MSKNYFDLSGQVVIITGENRNSMLCAKCRARNRDGILLRVESMGDAGPEAFRKGW